MTAVDYLCSGTHYSDVVAGFDGALLMVSPRNNEINAVRPPGGELMILHFKDGTNDYATYGV